MNIVATTNYLDYSIQQNETYYYKITAVNSLGEGNFSNEISISIPFNQISTSSTSTLNSSSSSILSSSLNSNISARSIDNSKTNPYGLEGSLLILFFFLIKAKKREKFA